MKARHAVSTVSGSAVAFAVLLGSASPEASAQEPTGGQGGPVRTVAGPVQQITLSMGKGALFQTATPFTKISVTDEKIVEVTPQSDRAFIVNPRDVGLTNVFVFDARNALIATLDVRVLERNLKTVRPEDDAQTNDEVRVYGRITNAQGLPARPAVYKCSRTNCENLGEVSAGGPGAVGTRTAGAHGAEKQDDGPVQ